MSTTQAHYAVYKRINGAWELWWSGHNPEAARSEFSLCLKYGEGAKCLAFDSLHAYHQQAPGRCPKVPAVAECPHRMELPTLRGVNALAVEAGTPQTRCALKAPGPAGTFTRKPGAGMRWLGSGGSPLAFGTCSCRECPLRAA